VKHVNPLHATQSYDDVLLENKLHTYKHTLTHTHTHTEREREREREREYDTLTLWGHFIASTKEVMFL